MSRLLAMLTKTQARSGIAGIIQDPTVVIYRDAQKHLKLNLLLGNLSGL